MAYFVKQYTVTATAATITSACGFTTKKSVAQLDVKAKPGNTGKVYLGASNVTNTPANAGAELAGGEAFSIVPDEAQASAVTTDDVYIVGTASDVAYITVIGD